MGRKRTHTDAPRTKIVSARLREDTHDKLTAAAAKAGLSRASYVEHLIENRAVKTEPAHSDALPVALINELKRIGNNLNQIAHSVHSELSPPEAAITAVVAELVRTIASNEVLQRRLTAAIDAGPPAGASASMNTAWQDVSNAVAGLVPSSLSKMSGHAVVSEGEAVPTRVRPAKVAASVVAEPMVTTDRETANPLAATMSAPASARQATEVAKATRPAGLDAVRTPLPIPAMKMPALAGLPPLSGAHTASDISVASTVTIASPVARVDHTIGHIPFKFDRRAIGAQLGGVTSLPATKLAAPLPFSLLDLLSGRAPTDLTAFNKDLDQAIEDAFPHAARTILLPKIKLAAKVLGTSNEPQIEMIRTQTGGTFKLTPKTLVMFNFSSRLIPDWDFYTRCSPTLVVPTDRPCTTHVGPNGITLTDDEAFFTRLSGAARGSTSLVSAAVCIDYDVLGNAYVRSVPLNPHGKPDLITPSFTPSWSIFRGTHFVPRPKP